MRQNADECFRCGYDLHGIADDQPCPECGLLARRSRQPSDALHVSRPRWLRRMSRGITLMLFVIPCAALWPVAVGAMLQWIEEQRYITQPDGSVIVSPRSTVTELVQLLSRYGGVGLTVLFCIGVLLVTSREGFDAADRADRWRRWTIRSLGVVPIIAACVMTYSLLQFRTSMNGIHAGFTMMTAGSAPLALLLFFHLRSAARRARSAHLAEHCAITGVGACVALLTTCAVYWTFVYYSERNPRWAEHGTTSLVLPVGAMVACILFTLWASYLLVRFAITFSRAARRLRRDWSIDDRSLELSDVSATL